MIDKCKVFLEEIGLFELSKQQRHVFAIVLLISPFSAGSLGTHFANDKQITFHLHELKRVFCQVYRENSVFLRQMFFNDALIRKLWPVYMKHKGKHLLDYLNLVKDG